LHAVFVHDDALSATVLSPDHPLRPERGRRTLDLCRGLGLLEQRGAQVLQPAPIGERILETVHDVDYIDALRRASSGVDESILRYNLGRTECPVFPGVFDYALACVAATCTGLEAILDGRAAVAFNPVGGMHHAMPGHAEGFCYLNDPAIALQRLVSVGCRPLYLDIDAHHGNGVQRVFYDRGDVLTISVHESGKTLYPFGGFETEIGEGPGRGFNVNFPLPVDTDDDLYLAVFAAVIEPLLEAYEPDVIVLVMGADTLSADPLAHLRLTNNGLAAVVRRVTETGVPILALGGGGYDLDAVTRAWTMSWAALTGVEVPEPDPALGGALAGSIEMGLSGLRDRRVVVAGAARSNNVRECIRVEEFLKRKVFPLHGIG
jgi:acetoin utilization protein AcuC